MANNQLPDGVGKKIVEALKRQAEADITPISEGADSIPLVEINEVQGINYEVANNNIESFDNMIVEEETITETAPIVNAVEEQPIKQETISFSQPIESKKMTPQQPTIASNISIPANVNTLRNLIAGLPVGVTKQTGAQIIRQTFEAMGVPISNVLKEAQEVQEELNSSSRECLLKIQEYKTNILQLEQSVQEYQKSITQINDLVSLFLMTDKN